MSNNLFVSYDLYRPGQSYDTVIEATKCALLSPLKPSVRLLHRRPHPVSWETRT